MAQTVEEGIQRRLALIEGQIRGLKNMHLEKRESAELLIQISAARAAIDSLAKVILISHIETCITPVYSSARKQDEVSKSVEEIWKGLSKYVR